MAIVLAIAVVTVLLGFGSDRSDVGGGHPPAPAWTLLEPQGLPLQPRAESDWISRARTAAFDVDSFRNHLLDQAQADQALIELPLFDDVSLIGRTRRVDRPHEDGFTWVADLEGTAGGYVIVSVRGDAAFGMVNAPGYGLYEFHPVPEQLVHERAVGEVALSGYIVREIDASKLPPCGVGPEHCVQGDEPEQHSPRKVGGVGERWRRAAAAREADGVKPGGILGSSSRNVEAGETAAGAETPTLRVMVAYTPAARNAVGGTQAMLAFIDSTIAQTNLAFGNSLIDMHAELALAHEVNYTGSGNITTDLFRITDPNDGYMTEVHDLRIDSHADLVALLVTYSGGACGVAWCMANPSLDFAPNGFSVTRIQCVSNLTFEHELGHNMGCHHDHQNSGGSCGTFPYSFGHRFFGNSGIQRRTILAYSPGQRIPHFSNPTVTFDGQPTGVPVGQSGEAHNAQTINLNAPFVTSFGDYIQPPAPPENNRCEDRIVITDGSTAFNSEHATTDGPAEPSLCTFFGVTTIQSDVWFEYTATCTGYLTAELCDSSFSTKFGIYESDTCPTEPDTIDACDITSCHNSLSRIVMPVTEGQPYIIRVGGRIANTGNGTISLVCEEEDPGIPGDLNDDGVVDALDLLILLSQWGGCSNCNDCPADLNDDCEVDAIDLLMLLQYWG